MRPILIAVMLLIVGCTAKLEVNKPKQETEQEAAERIKQSTAEMKFKIQEAKEKAEKEVLQSKTCNTQKQVGNVSNDCAEWFKKNN